MHNGNNFCTHLKSWSELNDGSRGGDQYYGLHDQEISVYLIKFAFSLVAPWYLTLSMTTLIPKDWGKIYPKFKFVM